MDSVSIQYSSLPEIKIHVILMPQWDTIIPQRLLLEFLFLKIIRSWKNKMCSTVHAVYVIQKVLQKHKFTILQAYHFSAELISTNFLLI